MGAGTGQLTMNMPSEHQQDTMDISHSVSSHPPLMVPDLGNKGHNTQEDRHHNHFCAKTVNFIELGTNGLNGAGEGWVGQGGHYGCHTECSMTHGGVVGAWDMGVQILFLAGA